MKEGSKALENRGSQCEDFFKMQLTEVQLDVAHWFYLAVERDHC